MDLNLNHSGDMIEDLLGNDRDITIHLRDSLRLDSKARFRLTAIIGGLIGSVGLIFMFFPFIPVAVSLWIMGMAVGMFLAGIFGMLFSMPLTDSVAVHLKVIDYVENVIKDTDYKKRNLMDDSDDDMIELSSDPVVENDEEEEGTE